jgi:hypothetical protein
MLIENRLKVGKKLSEIRHDESKLVNDDRKVVENGQSWLKIGRKVVQNLLTSSFKHV